MVFVSCSLLFYLFLASFLSSYLANSPTCFPHFLLPESLGQLRFFIWNTWAVVQGGNRGGVSGTISKNSFVLCKPKHKVQAPAFLRCCPISLRYSMCFNTFGYIILIIGRSKSALNLVVLNYSLVFCQ